MHISLKLLLSHYPATLAKFLFLLFVPFCCAAQDSISYPAHLHVLHDREAYLSVCRTDPNAKLENLSTFIPGITLDIRYASKNNFMHTPVYSQNLAYLRHAAAAELKAAQADFNKRGIGLIVYDAYRPYSVTVTIYKLVRNTDFAASPQSGSRHNRGCAVDLALIDMRTGKVLAMPTPFDAFSKKAHSNYMALPDSVLKNRTLLRKVMEAHHFIQLKTEWWHFDYSNWRDFDLLDIPFSAL